MTNSSYKEFSNIFEVSEYLGLEPSEVVRLIRKGKIQTFIDREKSVIDLGTLPDYLL